MNPIFKYNINVKYLTKDLRNIIDYFSLLDIYANTKKIREIPMENQKEQPM